MTKLIIIALSYTNAIAAFGINFYLMYKLDLTQFGYWSYTNSAAGLLAFVCMFGLPRYLMSCVVKTKNSFSREFIVGGILSISLAMIMSLYISVPSPHLLIVLCVSFIINEYSQVVAQTSQLTKTISFALLTSTVTRCSLFFLFIFVINNNSELFLLLSYAITIQLIFQIICYIYISNSQRKHFDITKERIFPDYSFKMNLMYYFIGLTSNASNHFIIFLSGLNSKSLGAEINIFLLVVNMITLLPGSIFTRLIDYQYQLKFEVSNFNLSIILKQTVTLFMAGLVIALASLKMFFLFSTKLNIDITNIINTNVLVLALFIAARFSQFPLSSYMNAQSNIAPKNIILMIYLGALSMTVFFLHNPNFSDIVYILLLLEFIKILTYASYLYKSK